ncbi:MAG: cation:proton antiporter [Candidatus Wenzhouxiangella sp. M2_3B_020]
MIDLIVHSVFGEVAILLALAALVGFLGLALRQPLIVSFIVVGLLAGPSVLDVVHSDDQIDFLAELGIAVLLFLVGMKLDVKLIRSLGAVALTTGLGQVAFTAVFGFLIGLALGLEPVASIYVAVALTFSSTIIIVKLLSDKREIDSLYGQVALGFLIVQDLVVVLAMIVLSTVGLGAGDGEGGRALGAVLGTALAMLLLVLVFVRYLADPLTRRLARVPELLVIFAIALAAIFAAAADAAGLGKELGGLMAGVALASTPYRETIASRLAPLRDFLLLFFFIALGSSLELSQLGQHFGAAAVFSLFVLIGNPLIVIAIMGAMGFRARTGFLAGLTVAQISEFSLIFVAMGVTLGHLGQEMLGLVTLVGLVTIALSTYMITYSHRLLEWAEPFLGIFERETTPREPTDGYDARLSATVEVVVFGLGRFGTALGQRLQRRGAQVVGMDFNPLAVNRWRSLGLPAVHGDAGDAERVGMLPVGEAQWVVSTIPAHAAGLQHEEPRLSLIQGLKSALPAVKVAATSHSAEETEALREAGADLVLEPFQDAADRAIELLSGARERERTASPPLPSEAPE